MSENTDVCVTFQDVFMRYFFSMGYIETSVSILN